MRFSKKTNYIFKKVNNLYEEKKDQPLEELNKEYDELLHNMEYANSDYVSFFWDTKVFCYLLNKMQLNLSDEKLKVMIESFED